MPALLIDRRCSAIVALAIPTVLHAFEPQPQEAQPLRAMAARDLGFEPSYYVDYIVWSLCALDHTVRVDGPPSPEAATEAVRRSGHSTQILRRIRSAGERLRV